MQFCRRSDVPDDAGIYLEFEDLQELCRIINITAEKLKKLTTEELRNETEHS